MCFNFKKSRPFARLASLSSVCVHIRLLYTWWGHTQMWHWLFATLSKPSPSPKIPSNEKQTLPGISCGVMAFSDFVLNPTACYETLQGGLEN